MYDLNLIFNLILISVWKLFRNTYLLSFILNFINFPFKYLWINDRHLHSASHVAIKKDAVWFL